MPAADERARLQHLADIEVEATAELARLRLRLGAARRLGPGDVLLLDKLAGERVTLRINGVALAEGETVVLDNAMALRLTGMVPVPGSTPAAVRG